MHFYRESVHKTLPIANYKRFLCLKTLPSRFDLFAC